MTKAVYPGSLDPVTYGHVSAIRDVAEGFGEVVVAIGTNPAKNNMFTLGEREDLVEKATAGIPGVSVTSFSGLLVHFLVRNDLDVVVRGVRNGQDLDDAMLQETIGWQQTLAKGIKAFYVPARPGQAFTSSTALKAVLKEQGDATQLAPPSTIHATQARMLGQYFYGVTGVSGSGKSTVSRTFAEIAAERNIPLLHVDMDKIGHAILGTAEDPLYARVRQKIKAAFGPDVLDDKGFIVRKKLGEAVFGNPENLKTLNGIMHDPVFFRLNDILRGKKGLFLIDAALLAETGRIPLVNNQVMLVEAKPEELAARLQQRDTLTPEQIERRLSSQFTTAAKAALIGKTIADTAYGHLDRLQTGDGMTRADAEKAFDAMLRHVDIYGELRITGFLKGLGVADADGAYTSLRKLYAGNTRFRNTLARVVGGLDRLPDLAVADRPAFTLALLLRDAGAPAEKTAAAWGIEPGLAARAAQLLVDGAAAPDAQLLASLGDAKNTPPKPAPPPAP